MSANRLKTIIFKDTKKYKRDSLKCVVNISMFFGKREREIILKKIREERFFR